MPLSKCLFAVIDVGIKVAAESFSCHIVLFFATMSPLFRNLSAFYWHTYTLMSYHCQILFGMIKTFYPLTIKTYESHASARLISF